MAARQRIKPVESKRLTSPPEHSSSDTLVKNVFYWKLWSLLCLANWILDFGRPIYAMYVSESFPLSLPSIGDYCHMLYNIVIALVLMELMKRSRRPAPKLLQVSLESISYNCQLALEREEGGKGGREEVRVTVRRREVIAVL